MLKPYLYHAEFETRAELCETLVRISEASESPEFRGKIFTLAEFKKWYKKSTNKNKFTYYEDWTGFNVPSKDLKKFYEGKFNPLSQKEKQFLETFQYINRPFYVIATFSRDRGRVATIEHEKTHALYCFEKSYRKEVIAYLKDKDVEELKLIIKKMGYNSRVVVDEINAYLVVDIDWLKKKKKLTGKQYDKYSKDLIEIRKKYQ